MGFNNAVVPLLLTSALFCLVDTKKFRQKYERQLQDDFVVSDQWQLLSHLRTGRPWVSRKLTHPTLETSPQPGVRGMRSNTPPRWMSCHGSFSKMCPFSKCWSLCCWGILPKIHQVADGCYKNKYRWSFECRILVPETWWQALCLPFLGFYRAEPSSNIQLHWWYYLNCWLCSPSWSNRICHSSYQSAQQRWYLRTAERLWEQGAHPWNEHVSVGGTGKFASLERHNSSHRAICWIRGESSTWGEVSHVPRYQWTRNWFYRCCCKSSNSLRM